MSVLAIDFGTSRIKAAYWDAERGEAVVLPLGKGGRLYVPSLFHVSKDGKIRFGDEAEVMLHHDPQGVVENLKLDLDKPIKYVPNGQQVKSAELMALLFRRIIDYASRQVPAFGGSALKTLVLTLPSRWDYSDIYMDALETIGYTGERLVIREPEAAGLAWVAEQKPKPDDMLVVLDFGGGTIDWACLRVDEKGLPQMIAELPPGGITAAGSHVDAGLLDEMMKLINEEQRQEVQQRRAQVLEQIRQLKESQNGTTTLSGEDGLLEVQLGAEAFVYPKKLFEQVVRREVIDQAVEGIGGYLRRVARTVKSGGDDRQLWCVMTGGTRLLSGLEERVKEQLLEIGKSSGVAMNLAAIAQADFATIRGAVLRAAPAPDPEPKPEPVSVSSALPNDSPNDLVMSIHNLAVRGDAESQYRLGRLYDEGQEIGLVYEEAVRWYSLAAGSGHMHAQFSLGVMYEHGRGVDQSDEVAAQWYLLAAEQGESMAQYVLGCMYDSGRGVPKSNEDAAKWYRSAAEKGDIRAQFTLGTMCLDGRGVSQNDEDALKWFLLAAEKGDIRAQYNLGMMYREARGVMQSNEKAAKWYLSAAEQGDVGAQLLLGKMYRGEWGYLPQDAVKWFQLAADQGESEAQYYLGAMYFNGIGVEVNKEIANTWFQRSAEQANESALFQLIENYSNGIGVPKSEQEAVKWCQFGAEKGIARAQKEFGSRNLMGQGVKKSYSEALKWFQRASDQGYSDAMFAIGTMYENGLGVPKSEEDSMKWYRLAAGKGNVDMKIEFGIKTVKKWWRNL